MLVTIGRRLLAPDSVRQAHDQSTRVWRNRCPTSRTTSVEPESLPSGVSDAIRGGGGGGGGGGRAHTRCTASTMMTTLRAYPGLGENMRRDHRRAVAQAPLLAQDERFGAPRLTSLGPVRLYEYRRGGVLCASAARASLLQHLQCPAQQHPPLFHGCTSPSTLRFQHVPPIPAPSCGATGRQPTAASRLGDLTSGACIRRLAFPWGR